MQRQMDDAEQMECSGCHIQVAGVRELRDHMRKPGCILTKGLRNEDFRKVVEREEKRQKDRVSYNKNLARSREKKKLNKRNLRSKEAREGGKYGPIFRYC